MYMIILFILYTYTYLFDQLPHWLKIIHCHLCLYMKRIALLCSLHQYACWCIIMKFWLIFKSQIYSLWTLSLSPPLPPHHCVCVIYSIVLRWGMYTWTYMALMVIQTFVCAPSWNSSINTVINLQFPQEEQNVLTL
jgi:hypothetical protein